MLMIVITLISMPVIVCDWSKRLARGFLPNHDAQNTNTRTHNTCNNNPGQTFLGHFLNSIFLFPSPQHSVDLAAALTPTRTTLIGFFAVHLTFNASLEFLAQREKSTMANVCLDVRFHLWKSN